MGSLTYIGPDAEVEVRVLRRIVAQNETVDDVDDALLDVNAGGLSWAPGHWLVNGEPQPPQVFDDPVPDDVSVTTDPIEPTE